MMSESQSNLDSLTQFMSARAALEESYAKSLGKLSKTGLIVNGECAIDMRRGQAPAHCSAGPAVKQFICTDSAAEQSLHPDVFEAIASLRGDVANESVQHKEMSYSINKDVLEPLGQLRESTEMVTRVVRAHGG